MHRPLSIPIALLALFAALEAACAYGAFIRVDVDTMVVDGDQAELVAFAALPEAAGPDRRSGPPAPAPSGPKRQQPSPSARASDPLAPNAGTSAASTSSHSEAGGPHGLVRPVASLPELPPLGRAPVEQGPRFANPPPWTPLKPPRADV